MPAALPHPGVNCLVESLTHNERNEIITSCETVDMVLGTVLHEPFQCYQHVYFPLAGFISLIATQGEHQRMTVGLIGNEGMLGTTLILGSHSSSMKSIVSGAGSALKMSTMHFLRALHASSRLLHVLQMRLAATIDDLSKTALCTRFHPIEQRLAYWLLLAQDRAHADNFYLTHEALADMLGVRRSGITVAAGALQTKALIHYTRGHIRVLNRTGLEAASCKCYKAQADACAHLFT